MTSHERLMRIFRNEETDRPALKLWGSWMYREGDWLLSDKYKPVAQRAAVLTDLFGGSGSPFNIYYGNNSDGQVETQVVPTANPLWVEHHHTYHTPLGDMRQVDRVSTVGEPGMTMEYAVKNEDDLLKLLSIKYEPIPFKSNHAAAVDALGERGVVCFGLDHAAYALHRLTGSENLAILSMENASLVDSVVAQFSSRIYHHVEQAIKEGIKAPFAWVGPELFIPPLMSPQGFEDYIYKYDKPLCDLIHNAGGHVWVHCHGKTEKFLSRFIEMGVDIINPLEPKPNGDVVMDEVVRKYGGKIGLEGNIEIQSIIQSSPEQLREEIKSCVEAGSKSGRFILCPSAGFMEYPFPEQRYIDNLMLYLEYGYECVTGRP
ncbi:MAG: uroporphyrinogen decarboxylase family protein [Eubacteriales bacterium]